MKIYIKAARKRAIKIARELYYSAETISKLAAAKNQSELTRILHDAREGRI